MISPASLAELKKKYSLDKRGAVLLYAAVFGFIAFAIVVAAVSSYAIAEHRASVYKHGREMSFQVAEAGINYYRWHLAHDADDYQDGTSTSGPYIHVYEDKDGKAIGHYSLNIIPPLSGSSVVTIESTGWLDSQPDSHRTIKARFALPSLTDYAVLTDSDIWIGDKQTVHGPFHSNSGIRFDGTGDAPITSAVADYICKEHIGCGNLPKPGIWGDGGPKSFWSFPVPAKDFTAVTANLSQIKIGAQPENGGLYLTSSGESGYLITFRSDSKIDVNKVTKMECHNGKDVESNKYVNYCIDIKTLGSTTTYNMPTSSYIFVEDTVWVQGVVNGRAVIGTAAGKSIIINNDITYYAKDGNHVLGLIAEQNILLPHNSPDDLEINAALLAQNGAAKRYFYPGNKKDSLIIYGSVISSGVWMWSWVTGGGPIVSGYTSTTMMYDPNLTFGPPPGFPVGSDYRLISWEEVKN